MRRSVFFFRSWFCRGARVGLGFDLAEQRGDGVGAGAIRVRVVILPGQADDIVRVAGLGLRLDAVAQRLGLFRAHEQLAAVLADRELQLAYAAGVVVDEAAVLGALGVGLGSVARLLGQADEVGRRSQGEDLV